MLGLRPTPSQPRPLRLLCLGAHSDDLEIGCGGTVLHLLRQHPGTQCRWVVFSATGAREREAREAADRLFEGLGPPHLSVAAFPDGFFPEAWGDLKRRFEQLKSEPEPDLILTHHRADRHQDHRILAELTWNTWRDQVILEYEVPKYDGDLHTPNLYVPLAPELVERKLEVLSHGFASQRDRPWFERETFLGLLRLRGVECRSPSGYAEGFHAPKLVLA